MPVEAGTPDAALEVGPLNSAREFKRLYGLSPKQWSQSHQHPAPFAGLSWGGEEAAGRYC